MRARRPTSPTFDPLEERVRELERELESACGTIIRLVPIEYQDTLASYVECNSTREYWAWRELMAEKIADRVPESAITEKFGERRADCPLCGSSTLGPYPDGFKIPRGLIHHLTGFGNARQCPVTAAAFELASSYVERNYGEAERAAEEAENEEKARLRATRRTTETLYKVHPFEPPELIDEGYRSWFGECRASDRLAWAEARVLALGFRRQQEGNVLALTLERDDHIIFADIRTAKKIGFNIFNNPPKKSKKLKMGHFDFPDNFVHDLRAKFEDRLDTATLQF